MVGCTGERSIRADFLWHSGGGDPGKANLQAHTALRPHRPAVGLLRPAGNMEPRYFRPRDTGAYCISLFQKVRLHNM
jgi:hypothetical protein